VGFGVFGGSKKKKKKKKRLFVAGKIRKKIEPKQQINGGDTSSKVRSGEGDKNEDVPRDQERGQGADPKIFKGGGEGKFKVVLVGKKGGWHLNQGEEKRMEGG